MYHGLKRQRWQLSQRRCRLERGPHSLPSNDVLGPVFPDVVCIGQALRQQMGGHFPLLRGSCAIRHSGIFRQCPGFLQTRKGQSIKLTEQVTRYKDHRRHLRTELTLHGKSARRMARPPWPKIEKIMCEIQRISLHDTNIRPPWILGCHAGLYKRTWQKAKFWRVTC